MRVLLVTGSSGGHIFPALALKDHLRACGTDVLLVLPKTGSGNKVFAESMHVEYIHAAKLDFNLGSKNIIGAYFFLFGAWEGLRVLIRFRPDVVVGFGSLNTVALLFWAWLFRIKTVIHEQNVVPGRANRLLAKLADKVAVSFSQTYNYLNICPQRIVLTGNPIRKDLVRLGRKEALSFLNFKEGKFNILITGGSQGSHKLNTVCFGALSSCHKENDLQVIHISGAQDFMSLKRSYAQSGLTHKVFDFLPNMQYVYSIADLVICRAGASTIAELQRFTLPALLIPYPFAYAHQLSNARVLSDSGSALIIRDEELCVEKLRDSIQEFLDDAQKLEHMRQAYAQTRIIDAVELLANEVLK